MAIETMIKRLRNIMRQDDDDAGDAQRLRQIVWLLFLKLFDAQEKEWQIEKELKMEKYESILPNDLRWDNWAKEKDGMTGERLLDFVNNRLFPTLRELKGNTLKHQIVRDIFKGAFNAMRSGTLLRQVINTINEVDFGTKKDRYQFNEIYETMLVQLNSAGSAGEFYTPRPVTDFMADMVKPQLNEKVLDFACGTGGFLISATEYIEKSKQIKSANDVKIMQQNITGVEKKQFPYALCITNLMLHGIDEPNIIRGNSLKGTVTDFTESEQVDVVLANPPYGGKEEDGIVQNFPAEVRTKETADLFLHLLIEKLKHNGRAGIVLPDSILFDESNVKTNLKKRLFEEFDLHTIVKLPRGVFYAKINTNLLFFNKGEKTKDIWYYDLPLPANLKNGFNKTNPLKHEHFDEVKKWWNNREENKNAYKVNVEDVIKNNYNLDVKNPSKVVKKDDRTVEEVFAEIKKDANNIIELLNKVGGILGE